MKEFNAAKAYLIAELEKLLRLYQLSGRDYETTEWSELHLTYAGCRYTLRFEDSASGVRERIDRLKKTRPPKVFKPLPIPSLRRPAYSESVYRRFINDEEFENAAEYAAMYGVKP